jgi:hypothetical protein
MGHIRDFQWNFINPINLVVNEIQNWWLHSEGGNFDAASLQGRFVFHSLGHYNGRLVHSEPWIFQKANFLVHFLDDFEVSLLFRLIQALKIGRFALFLGLFGFSVCRYTQSALVLSGLCFLCKS